MEKCLNNVFSPEEFGQRFLTILKSGKEFEHHVFSTEYDGQLLGSVERIGVSGKNIRTEN
jgi:hypothetical protein